MLLLAIVILFGNSSQASAQTAQDNYLDLANYETIGKPASGLKNYYVYTPNEENNTAWLTMSAYGAYHATNNNNTDGVKNKWITTTNPAYSSISTAWGASDPFSGGAAFFVNNAVYVFGNNNSNYRRDLYFYVTSCTEIRLIGKNLYSSDPYPSSSITLYEGTFDGNSFSAGNQVDIPNSSNTSPNKDVSFTVSGLDYNKIYRVRVRSSLSHIYEIAFKTVIDPKGTAFGSYLDITKYQTIDAAGWRTNLVNNLYKYTEYPNDNCAWLTLPVYGAYVGTSYAPNSTTSGSGHPQKWIESNVSNTNQVKEVTWNATDVYLGSEKYFTSVSAKAVGTNSSSSSNKTVTFYVTNTTGVKLYGYHNGGSTYPTTLSAYVCIDNGNGSLTVETTATNDDSQTNIGEADLSITDLDASKIYKIVVSQACGYLYEIGFQTPLEVTADVEAVDGVKSITNFWQAPHYTHEQTFKVTAKNIKNSTVEISSSNPDVFDVSPTTITAAEAKAGKNVIVTFKPQSPNLDDPVQEGSTYNDGQFSATIDIKYNTHLYDQVNVTGKTYHYPVTVSNAKLSTLYYDKPLVIPYESSDGKLLNVEYVKNLNSNENTAEMRSVTQIEKEDASGNLHYIIPDMFGVIIETSEAMTYRFPVYNNYKNEQLTIDGNNLKGLLEDTETKVIKAQYGENAKILTLGKRTGSTDEYGFYKYSGETMSANKAYLVYESQSGASNDAIFFSIGRSSSENTAIQEVETAIKQMEGGTWYTLQGVRLNDKPTQRGLYLHNGKKIIVK